MQRAIALGKALREYQIPAYIVEGASDQVLRLIFKRVNTSGVAMEESEVFGALFRGNEAHPIECACARLETATGFGDLHPYWFLRCIKAVEGLSVAEDITEEQVLKLDPSAVERAENALLRAVRFLIDDAGIAHFQLLPCVPWLVILARFFHLHPRPAERTRTLLSRWLWRGALFGHHLGSRDGTIQQESRLLDGDEFASVERLLRSVQATLFSLSFFSASRSWSSPETHFEQICALALAHLGPRDPETGEPITGDQIRALLGRRSFGDVFLDVEGLVHSTAVRRVLLLSYDHLEKLPTASPEILASHGLDQEAADALGRGDLATFVERRTPILDRWFQRFFAERIGADDNDRPPVAELIRRVDKAFAAS